MECRECFKAALSFFGLNLGLCLWKQRQVPSFRALGFFPPSFLLIGEEEKD